MNCIFMTRDRNNVQPLRNAAPRLFRWAFLNGAHKYCVEFSQNLVHALKYDYCVSEAARMSAWNKIEESNLLGSLIELLKFIYGVATTVLIDFIQSKLCL